MNPPKAKIDVASIPPSLSCPAPLPSPTWQVGTLSYTTGGLAILFCWLLWGDFAWFIRDRTVPPVLQILFKHYGASDTFTGFLITSLPAAMSLVIGPIIGYKSDRLRSRWGRRIPFLLLPTPFIVFAVIGLAFSSDLGLWVNRLLGFSLDHMAAGILICLAVFWTIFEIACTVANSVFGALINDVVPQVVIGRFFGLFRVFSLLAGILVNFYLLAKAENNYVLICLGVALIYGVGFSLMCFNVREGAYLPPETASRRKGFLAAITTYFRDSIGNSYYRWFFATSILCNVAALPFNSYSLFYAKSIGMPMDAYFHCIAGTFAISLLLAYPLGVLVDRFHPLRVTLVVTALYGLTMAFGLFFVRDSFSFATILMLHIVLNGAYYTASASLNQKLLPSSKFAEIASAGSVLLSLATIALPLIIGSMLDHTHHNYRDVFYWGLILALFAILVGTVVYRKFLALGGDDSYVPPG